MRELLNEVRLTSFLKMKTVLKEFKTVGKSWLLILLFCAAPALPQTDECECIESMNAECVVFLDFVCLCCITTHCVNSYTV